MRRLSAFLLGVILSAILIGFLSTDEIHADKGKLKYAHPEAIASTDWLQTHLKDDDIRIVDCSVNIRVVDCSVSFINPNSYTEGHIPGAVSLEVMKQLSDPKGRVPWLILPSDQFESLMGKLGISNDTTVVVYDAFGGAWAARLWWALMYYGHNDVKMLNGGIRRWKAEGKCSTILYIRNRGCKSSNQAG